MNVKVNSIDDFCDEIREATVLDSVVRVMTDKGWHQEERVSCDVQFCATAIISCGDGQGEYLLQFEEVVGEDIAGRSDCGTRAAAACRQKVSDACVRANVLLRPGKIEVT